MPSFAGTPRSALFWPGPAARYRELRANWGIALLAVLVLLAPWALALSALEAVRTMPRPLLAAQGLTLHLLLHDALVGAIEGSSGLITVPCLVAAALGIALFAHDRIDGGLFSALEGPLARREAWLAKAIFGAVVIGAGAAVGTATLLYATLATGNADLVGPVLLSALVALTGELSLFVTGLALAGALSTALSALGTATWAALPALAGGLVETVFVRPYAQPLASGHLATVLVPTAWATTFGQALTNLSPFRPDGLAGWSPWEVMALVAWFVLWTGLLTWQGLGWWQKAPFERLHDTVFFPSLWNLYDAWLGLATGLVATTVATGGEVKGPAWVAVYGATSLVAALAWRSALRHRRARARTGAWPA